MSEYAEQQKAQTLDILNNQRNVSLSSNGQSERQSDESWMDQSACRDKPPGMFFPSDGSGVIAAKKICEVCVVKEECLEFALSKRIDHGVWGGMSERERRRIIKGQK